MNNLFPIPLFVYYESRKRKPQTRLIYEYRCDERPKNQSWGIYTPPMQWAVPFLPPPWKKLFVTFRAPSCFFFFLAPFPLKWPALEARGACTLNRGFWAHPSGAGPCQHRQLAQVGWSSRFVFLSRSFSLSLIINLPRLACVHDRSCASTGGRPSRHTHLEACVDRTKVWYQVRQKVFHVFMLEFHVCITACNYLHTWCLIQKRVFVYSLLHTHVTKWSAERIASARSTHPSCSSLSPDDEVDCPKPRPSDPKPKSGIPRIIKGFCDPEHH